MKFNIFTTCTASGTVPAVESLDGVHWDEYPSHQEFRDAWCKEEKSLDKDDQILVKQLYSGTSFQTVHAMRDEIIAADHEVCVKVVSLGYGLLDWEDSIHPYNLSLVQGSKASLHRIVAGERFSPERWWAMINSGLSDTRTPITDYLRTAAEAGAINIVCVSSTFLQLISDDLLDASRSIDIDFVIVGPTSTSQMIKSCRLLAKSGFIQVVGRDKIRTGLSGNKYNFAQRCAHQIVSDKIESPNTSLREIVGKYEGSNSPIIDKGPDLAAFVGAAHMDKKPLDEAFRKYVDDGGTVSYIRFAHLYEPKQKATDDDLMKAAVSMLEKISLSDDTGVNDEEAMEVLTTFRDALEQAGKKGAAFTAGDVASWAKLTYDSLNRELSPRITEPRKLTHFIKAVGPALGFIEEGAPGQVKKFRYTGMPL